MTCPGNEVNWFYLIGLGNEINWFRELSVHKKSKHNFLKIYGQKGLAIFSKDTTAK